MGLLIDTVNQGSVRGENSPHESCLLARSISNLLNINSNLWGGIPTPFAIQCVRLSIIALPGANNDLQNQRLARLYRKVCGYTW